MKNWISQLPLVGTLMRRSAKKRLRSSADSIASGEYWNIRYQAGGNSGPGSFNRLAEFKAEILNEFVRDNHIETVIEYGCGDGNQLQLAHYPRYTGYDISPRAITLCKALFSSDSTKSFREMEDYSGETAQLTLSLDVIYHLVEDPVFEAYMHRLFESASDHVIIYSSNTDDNEEGQPHHVRHRKFTDWVTVNIPQWSLARHIPNRYPFTGDVKTGSFADFYFYVKT